MKGGEGNEKEGTTIRLWRIHRDLFRLSTTRHSTAPPTLRHSSSLPPLILEISNSSTVPSKFKPWLAIFSSSLHIPPMIGSRIGFLSFSFQYSDKLSIFFFFFLSFLDFPFLYTYRQLNLSNQTFLIL